VLSGLLNLAGKQRGQPFEITKMTLERQCDPEYVDICWTPPKTTT
jgi:hypothetical protein